MIEGDKRKRILLIDDSRDFQSLMSIAFTDSFLFDSVYSPDEIDAAITNGEQYDLVLLDLVLDNSGRYRGLELIDKLKGSIPNTPIVILSLEKESNTIREAIQTGADDYMYKGDYDPEKWENAIRYVISTQHTLSTKQFEEETIPEFYWHNWRRYPFIGKSDGTLKIKKELLAIADQPDISLLIKGEMGVGKSIAARFIHCNSKRREFPFEEVSIPTIGKDHEFENIVFGNNSGVNGKIKNANKGIVFFREIAELDLNKQARLIPLFRENKIRRVGTYAEEQVNIQVIASTSKDLEAEVKANRFRSDLYHSIISKVEIPPIRSRREDIGDLLVHFLKLASSDELYAVFDDIALNLLIHDYEWKQYNVRELENVALNAMLRRKNNPDKRIHREDILSNLSTGGISNEKEVINTIDKDSKRKEMQQIFVSGGSLKPLFNMLVEYPNFRYEINTLQAEFEDLERDYRLGIVDYDKYMKYKNRMRVKLKFYIDNVD